MPNKTDKKSIALFGDGITGELTWGLSRKNKDFDHVIKQLKMLRKILAPFAAEMHSWETPPEGFGEKLKILDEESGEVCETHISFKDLRTLSTLHRKLKTAISVVENDKERERQWKKHKLEEANAEQALISTANTFVKIENTEFQKFLRDLAEVGETDENEQ